MGGERRGRKRRLCDTTIKGSVVIIIPTGQARRKKPFLTLKIRGTVGFGTDINVCASLEKKFSLSLRFVEKTPYIYIYIY